MRDCKKCKHFVKSNEGHTEALFGDLYDCEKWECEFDPEEPTTKNDLGVDCISRQDVLSEIIRFSTEEGASVECQQLYCDVNNIPSVTPQEPTTGHWITKPHVYGVTYCSECDFELKIDNTNYCPNCGAKMAESEGDK